MTKRISLFLVCLIALSVVALGIRGVRSQAPAVTPPKREAAHPNLLTSEPVTYVDTKTIALMDKMIDRAGPVPKYRQQMADIIAQRLKQETKTYEKLGLPLAEKSRRVHALVVGSEKEVDRVATSHFTQPFNVRFPPVYEDDKKKSSKPDPLCLYP